jgi:multicomponent Na+:H+ antiporter subunit D
LTGSVLHWFNHALTKGAMFLLLGGVVLRVGGVGFERIAGLGRTMPLTAFAFVIAGLSLVGVPATVGVVSKWYLVLAAVEAGAWWLAAAVLLGSLLAVAYVWRFVEAAYFRPPPADRPRPGEAPLSMLVPACLMVAACVYFGLDATWTATSAAEAAQALLTSRGAP